MILFDVNILLYAMRADRPEYRLAKPFLVRHLGGAEPVGWHPMLGSAVLRVSTHPTHAFHPSTAKECLAFLEDFQAAPAVLPISEGPGFWTTFEALVLRYDVVGNRVPYAYLAALAIDHSATLISADRGFSAFQELDFELVEF